MHCVAVPNHAADETVRQFGCYTVELNALADWLTECGVKIVAMESAGCTGSRCTSCWSGGGLR